MNESTRHFDLLKAFDQPRCPICNMVMRDLQQDMDILLLERINKVPTHLAFRAGRGLCNAHAHQLTKARGGAPGIAVMYESTMVEFVKDLAKINPMKSQSGFSRLMGNKSVGITASQQLDPTGNCLMCDSMNKNEKSYVSIIAENVTDEKLIQAFEQSIGGVCLPHGQQILTQFTKSSDVEQFLAIQSPKWHELHQDLKQYIKNNDDNVPQHKMGKEADSWSRAIRYLSGEEHVFGYRRFCAE